MEDFKQMMKDIWKNIWMTFKSSFMASFMYSMAGIMMLTLSLNSEDPQWTSGSVTLFVVAVVVAAVYNGFLLFAMGGKGYEMLVSGNMKRRSAEMLGMEYKISSHKEEDEYRDWKGFAIGAWMVIIPLVCGLLFGANQNLMVASEDGGIIFLRAVGLFICGWALYPFYFANYTAVVSVSYYWSLLFLLIPVIVSGVMYIVGAYARRNKAIREQELADRAAKAEENKVKKINYGGLPGTKPRKRK
jgi:hypothetical protein